MASQLQLYSLGIVLNDKPADSWEIEVKPIETNGFSDGLLSTDAEETQVTGVNAQGESYSETAKSVHGVIAKWYPDHANRLSAPDVTKGEEVELYKFADDDQFYWKATNISHEYRTKETIVVAASNKAKKDKLKLDATNSYFMEMCTRSKQVSLRTNKNDGEPYGYLVQVNTKDGAVIIEDDVGNIIQLDSSSNTITLLSAAGSTVTINENIALKTGGNVTVNAAGNISFDAGGKITGKAGSEISWNAGAAFNVTAGANYTIGASTYVINTANVKASDGGMTINSNFETIGTFLNNGVNVGSTHTHTEQGDGKDVSKPK